MRKIVVGAMVSLDGVMQAPGGPTEDPTKGFEFGVSLVGTDYPVSMLDALKERGVDLTGLHRLPGPGGVQLGASRGSSGGRLPGAGGGQRESCHRGSGSGVAARGDPEWGVPHCFPVDGGAVEFTRS
jgi:hypothetical protein